MDAETRAALEWAYDYAATMTLAADHPTDKKLFSSYARTLQALLDEKGGGVPGANPAVDIGHRKSGQSNAPPPDSPAKIAADLRLKIDVCYQNGAFCAAEYRKHYSLNEASEAWHAMEANLRGIAARIEALGLEPGERETVRQVVRWCAVLGNRDSYGAMSPFQETAFKLCSDIIAALTPIAERK